MLTRSFTAPDPFRTWVGVSSSIATGANSRSPHPNARGHAVMAVGYNDSQERFIVRNSWNTDWGMKGYFTMPYEYLSDRNLADDFWTIRTIE